mmetsp:Transcript_8152/g.13150  ORF Transcript_8152/g.13150 Transcript_8152/m.13150 type:complete len:167 (-) Transcript_8152:79-579(-)
MSHKARSNKRVQLVDWYTRRSFKFVSEPKSYNSRNSKKSLVESHKQCQVPAMLPSQFCNGIDHFSDIGIPPEQKRHDKSMRESYLGSIKQPLPESTPDRERREPNFIIHGYDHPCKQNILEYLYKPKGGAQKYPQQQLSKGGWCSVGTAKCNGDIRQVHVGVVSPS